MASLEQGVAAIVAADPAFERMVRAAPPFDPGIREQRDYFNALVRAIVFQQLAGRAALAIHGRFIALFDGPPSPQQVLAAPEEALRGAGLSTAKTAAIRDLAAKVDSGLVPLERIEELADDDIVSRLVQVRGIGRWTAEMFLIFQLRRLDVWPVDDLGVRRGYALIHSLPRWPTPKEMGPLGEPYRPYRSIAAWYCWRTADTILPDGAEAGASPSPPSG